MNSLHEALCWSIYWVVGSSVLLSSMERWNKMTDMRKCEWQEPPVLVHRLMLVSLSAESKSVQLIFSILLQHHISKLSRYLWCTSKFQHHTQLYARCSTFLVYFLNFTFNLLLKRAFCMWNVNRYMKFGHFFSNGSRKWRQKLTLTANDKSLLY